MSHVRARGAALGGGGGGGGGAGGEGGGGEEGEERGGGGERGMRGMRGMRRSGENDHVPLRRSLLTAERRRPRERKLLITDRVILGVDTNMRIRRATQLTRQPSHAPANSRAANSRATNSRATRQVYDTLIGQRNGCVYCDAKERLAPRF